MYYSQLTFATLLSAASAHVLKRTDQCYALSGTSCSDLSLGQKDVGKQVCTTVSGSNLIVSYPVVSGYPYSEVHVYLGGKAPSSSAPSQFPYTSGNGYCTVASDGSTATCTIPISEFGTCGGSYYIATHSAQGSETGWGNGECIGNKCHPWATYWDAPIKIDCTPCSTTPASTTKTRTRETPASTPSSYTTSTKTKKTETASTPSLTGYTTPTPSYPACWQDCWTKNGVSEKEQACDNSKAKKCIDQNCASDADAYHSWLSTDCTTSSSTTWSSTTKTSKTKSSTTSTSTTTSSTKSLCKSKSTPPPVVTSTPCPKKTSSVSRSTYESTEYITTVLTSVVTKTAKVTNTYTITGTCKATVTPAPVVYTTTCAAYS